MSPILLSVRDLSISVAANKQVLVKSLNLDLKKGTCVTLVGESGSGKSLTAFSVMRLLHPALCTSGDSRILFNGTDLTTLPEKDMRRLRGKDIGMIFQEPMSALNPLHTIQKQIAEAIRIHQPSIHRSECADAVAELLEDVSLTDMLAGRGEIYPHELSGGQRQRVMIAMALANDPALLIADEPTTALDVTTQATILDLLAALQEKRGAGLLLITHDLKLAARYADHCYVMKSGEVIESGAATHLLQSPDHDYTKLLLESRTIQPRSYKKTDNTDKAASEPTVTTNRFYAGYGERGFFRTHTRYVLQDITLSLMPEKTLGIVGGSGSGKTTLAMALLAMTPSKGEASVAGVSPVKPNKETLRHLRRTIHIVFQDPFGSLNPRMTVGDILTEGPKAQGMKEKCNHNFVSRLLEDVGLDPDSHTRYPHAFSGGQRQRIALARALAMDPKVLILDEPTSALDVVTRKNMLALLRRLQKERGMSYVLISHDMHVIAGLSDDIIVLKDGKAVEYGAADDVLHRPQHPYTQTLAKAAAI